MKKLKVCMVASEMFPLVKSGGLADVVGSLPLFMSRLLMCEVCVVIPKYSVVDISSGFEGRVWKKNKKMSVLMGGGLQWCGVFELQLSPGVVVYLIEHDGFFERRGLYGDDRGQGYVDNPHRFGFLCKAALELCKNTGFIPDVFHIHDWQTAVLSCYLKTLYWGAGDFESSRVVLTIHNGEYQGEYSMMDLEYLGLGFCGSSFEKNGKLNLLKGGIFYADKVNTVSRGYASQMLTEELGQELQEKGRNGFVGIVNGVDYHIWSPEKDLKLACRYSLADMKGKGFCKEVLQREFGLKKDGGIPLVGMVGRICEQKGYHLLVSILDELFRELEFQLVILGAGDRDMELDLENKAKEYKARMGVRFDFDEKLSHWIYGGADFLLMPSIYEPCGLGQLYALRYGTIPIVRATGGLDDTVKDYDERTGKGTGFKFLYADPKELYHIMEKAIQIYYNKKGTVQRIVQSGMGEDFSWVRSAKEYIKIYGDILNI